MPDIQYFNQEISFKLPKPRKTSAWLRSVLRREGQELSQVNYIFCSDAYLLNINKEFLNHHTLTDIITFDNSEPDGGLEADIFISIERVTENAEKMKIPFEDELHRVMVHGVLHLCGYGDKTRTEKAMMREKEDAYLSLRNGPQ